MSIFCSPHGMTFKLSHLFRPCLSFNSSFYLEELRRWTLSVVLVGQ